MLAMPAGIPAGMVADSPILRIPCLRAPQPEPAVHRQPISIEYPREGGLCDRPPHENLFRRRNTISTPVHHSPVTLPRLGEHLYMQHKVHKSYPRHQRVRSASDSPPRNDEPLVAFHHPIHGSARRPPRMENITILSKYASAPSLQKPDFSLQAHETLLRQAAMRAALGTRQSKPVERPARHPLPTARPVEKPKDKHSQTRQTRRMLSDREKMDICLFHEHHRCFTHKEVADKFGVERTTVTKILLNKQQHLCPRQ